ncbi:hypothetical protein DAPK24_001890 [Pichia kluyveri]|uniref:Uncharacterized protein n=1 Tax=Pichia kluyveri TaxID=36015 RepID=A0AAV5QWJ1_PICKL|nr:hypothetical protein DAPK24_001890 [Pichia kluyveri]
MTAYFPNSYSDLSASILSDSTTNELYQLKTPDLKNFSPRKKSVRFNDDINGTVGETVNSVNNYDDSNREAPQNNSLPIQELFSEESNFKKDTKEESNVDLVDPDSTLKDFYFHSRSYDPETDSNQEKRGQNVDVVVGNSYDVDTNSTKESYLEIPIGHKVLNIQGTQKAKPIPKPDQEEVEIKVETNQAISPKEEQDEFENLFMEDASSSKYSTETDIDIDSSSNNEHYQKITEVIGDINDKSSIEDKSIRVRFSGNDSGIEIRKPELSIRNVNDNGKEIEIETETNNATEIVGHHHFDTNYVQEENIIRPTLKSNDESINRSGWDLKRKLSFSLGKTALLKEVEELKEENKFLIERVELQEAHIKDLKLQKNEYFENLNLFRSEYNTLTSENSNLLSLYKKSERELSNANLKLITLQQINEMEQSKQLIKDIERKTFIPFENKTIKSFQTIIETTNAKNQYLQEVFTFLSKRINDIYQFTIAPALYLASVEIESVSDNISFDSHNSIQAYINSNFIIFKEAYEFAKLDKIENVEQYKLDYQSNLEDLEKYFDNLNDLIAGKMEGLIRQKMQL